MQQVLIIFTFIYLFYIVNLVSFPAAPSVQDPRPGGSTIRGFVPHIPEEPSGMMSAEMLPSFFAWLSMQFLYMWHYNIRSPLCVIEPHRIISSQ